MNGKLTSWTRPFSRRACITILASALLACSDSHPAAPKAQVFDGTLNNVSWSGAPTAVIVPGNGNPDRLILIGSTNDVTITIKITVNGIGSYDLANAQVSLLSLVGGDVQTGGYVGSAVNPGVLDITEYDGVGGTLRATLNFNVDHLNGEQRFGSSVAFRNGHVVAKMLSAID